MPVSVLGSLLVDRRCVVASRLAWTWIAALWLTGCDCSGNVHTPGGPCAAAEPPAECNEACSAARPCIAGFYCHSSGVCTADCAFGTSSESCAAPSVCRRDGRCIAPGEDAGPIAQIDASNSCADVTVMANRVTPNVILIIDQSGSMNADFGGDGARWNVLHETLMEQPGGLIDELQSSVRFGVALYTAEAPDQSEEPVPGQCPLITWVEPALDNYDAIATEYVVDDWIDETPTGESIDDVLARVVNVPDPSSDPTIFILATDGEPDTCEAPNPQNGQAESIAAVERAYDAGIRTFVIAVGNDVGETHLQDVANAGRGMPQGTSCPLGSCYFRPDDNDGLRETLRDIIGGQLSCVVTLEGMIEDISQACVGTVALNGTPLACDTPNGWRVIDSTHIELVGEACTILQNTPGVTLTATFPCGIILI
jgi:hypothetical protein